MSLEKYIRIYPAIPDAKTITKFLKYLNKTFKDKKFVTGSIAGQQEDIVDKKVRDVEILGLGPQHDSLSNVHWHNYLSYLIIQQMNKYIKDFANAGADIITIHPEATPNLQKSIDEIKSFKKY